jgi:hypothetical protein
MKSKIDADNRPVNIKGCSTPGNLPRRAVTAQWFLAGPSDQRLSALDGRGRRTGAKAAERMTSWLTAPLTRPKSC